MWIPAYILILTVIWTIRKEYSTKASVIILSILVLIQYSDITGWLDRRGGEFGSRYQLNAELPSSAWNELAKQYNRFFFLDNVREADSVLYSFGNIAVNNQMILNDFYLARKDRDMINTYKSEELNRILNGEAADDTVYLLGDSNKFRYFLANNLNLYIIDDQIIGLKNEFSFSDSSIRILSEYDQTGIIPPGIHHMREAEFTNDTSIIIFPGGAVWSQYMDLMPGEYRFTFHGINFTDALFDISYEDGSGQLDVDVVELTDNSVELILVIDQNAYNVHARCFNLTELNIIIDHIFIERYR